MSPGRWLTKRCWEEDLSSLSQAHAGINNHLAVQDPKSSGTEQFAGRTRSDTYTYHHGNGRGARWRDDARSVLWLLCFADGHDAGYVLGHELAAAGRLYPDLAETFDTAHGEAVVAWGLNLDEDGLENAAHLLAVLETLEDSTSGAGRVDRALQVAVVPDAEDATVVKVTVRLLLDYADPGSARTRWLLPAEVEDFVRVLLSLPEDEVVFFQDPPHADFRYVDVYAVGQVAGSHAWLAGLGTRGWRPPLVAPDSSR